MNKNRGREWQPGTIYLSCHLFGLTFVDAPHEHTYTHTHTYSANVILIVFMASRVCVTCASCTITLKNYNNGTALPKKKFISNEMVSCSVLDVRVLWHTFRMSKCHTFYVLCIFPMTSVTCSRAHIPTKTYNLFIFFLLLLLLLHHNIHI